MIRRAKDLESTHKMWTVMIYQQQKDYSHHQNQRGKENIEYNKQNYFMFGPSFIHFGVFLSFVVLES